MYITESITNGMCEWGTHQKHITVHYTVSCMKNSVTDGQSGSKVYLCHNGAKSLWTDEK